MPKPGSTLFKTFWMPVEDPVISGDQVRHDGFRTFYGIVNVDEFVKSPA